MCVCALAQDLCACTYLFPFRLCARFHQERIVQSNWRQTASVPEIKGEHISEAYQRIQRNVCDSVIHILVYTVYKSHNLALYPERCCQPVSALIIDSRPIQPNTHDLIVIRSGDFGLFLLNCLRVFWVLPRATYRSGSGARG